MGRIFDNEKTYGNDDLNNTPSTGHKKGAFFGKAGQYAPGSAANVGGGSIRITSIDTESVIIKPHQNVNASGIKRV